MAGWGRWEAGSQGSCGENEGGWSIPEAAGAKGCLLGCAGPTRSSFRAATPAEGRRGKEQDQRRKAGSSARPYRGLLQTLEGRDQAGRGPRRWRSTPSLVPILLGFLGGDSPRQVGDGPWLEREKCPEKRTVPVGSRDVCSTVHGSYQLSTDPPQPCPMTASRPAQPQPHTCMQAGRHHSTLLCPLGIRSWLVPIPHPPPLN